MPAQTALAYGRADWLDFGGNGHFWEGFTIPLRRLGRADIEFYDSALVLCIACALPGKPYASLSYRARQARLDQAVTIAAAILNNATIIGTMSQHIRRLSPES